MTDVLTGRLCEHTKTPKEESHVTTEAETREMHPQTKKHQRFLEPPGIRERHGIDFLYETSEGTNSADSLILDFWPPEL